MFVSEIGFRIQKPSNFLPAEGRWAYNPVASGQINVCLPTNPEQDMVGKGRDLSAFQFSPTKNYSEIRVLKELIAQKIVGHDTLSLVVRMLI